MAKVRYLGTEELFTYRSAPSGKVYDFHARDLIDVDIVEDIECFRGGNFEIIESGVAKTAKAAREEAAKALEKVKGVAGRKKRVG